MKLFLRSGMQFGASPIVLFRADCGDGLRLCGGLLIHGNSAGIAADGMPVLTYVGDLTLRVDEPANQNWRAA